MHEDAAFALDSAAHDGAEEAASLFASIAMAAVQVPEPPPPKPAAPSFTSFLPPPKDNESADLFANMTLADIVAPTVSAETGFGTAFGAEATPAAAPAAFSFGVPDTQAEPNPFAFAAADAAVACADGADDAPGEASGSGEGSIATACPSAAADDAVTIAVVGAPKAFKSTFIRLAQGVKADGKYTPTTCMHSADVVVPGIRKRLQLREIRTDDNPMFDVEMLGAQAVLYLWSPIGKTTDRWIWIQRIARAVGAVPVLGAGVEPASGPVGLDGFLGHGTQNRLECKVSSVATRGEDSLTQEWAHSVLYKLVSMIDPALPATATPASTTTSADNE